MEGYQWYVSRLCEILVRWFITKESSINIVWSFGIKRIVKFGKRLKCTFRQNDKVSHKVIWKKMGKCLKAVVFIRYQIVYTFKSTPHTSLNPLLKLNRLTCKELYEQKWNYLMVKWGLALTRFFVICIVLMYWFVFSLFEYAFCET